jgi:hypothetical protein
MAWDDTNTCKKVIREQREDSDDIVIEKRRTARRMAHRSTAGEIHAYGIIDLDHFATTSAVFCIKITKHVGKKDMVKV